MKTTKTITVLLALAMLAMLLSLGVSAAEETTVYVTVSNGAVVLAHSPVSVTDIDGDGKLTINDALALAHDAYYAGGSSAGYASAASEWGLSLTRLWGVENGGSYGYYLNNASAMDLADPVADGDSIYAFVYTDTVGFTDTYCYFDKNTLTAEAGESVTVTLSCAGYDANWQPTTSPLAGAVITVDGKATDAKTDDEGRAVITLGAGEHVIGAVHDEKNITPPVCLATVSEAKAPQTGDNGVNAVCIIAAITALTGCCAAFARRKNDAV